MADEKRKVSLVITAKDQASAVIRGTSTVIQGIAGKIGGAFALAGKVAVGMNQALELTKKVLAGVSAAYAATVAKALELRGANDPARRDLEELSKAAAGLQVALGNALIPVVQALAQSLAPVLRSWTAWVDANRQLIGTTVLEWAVNLGRTLVSTVATGALLAARAWYGFGFAVDAVQAAAQAFFAAWAEGNAELLGWMADLAAFAGQDGLAGRLRGLSQGLTEWGVAGQKAADANIASMEATGLELMSIERGINKAVDAANNGLGSVAVNAVKNFGNAVVLAGKAVGTLKGDADGAYQAWLQFTTATAKANIGEGARQLQVEIHKVGAAWEAAARNAELQDQVLAAQADRARAALQPIIDVASAGVSALASATSGLINDIVDGSKTAAEVVGGFFSNIGRGLLDALIQVGAQLAINALTEKILGAAVRTSGTLGYVAQAAAAAFASTAAIPIVGPALAPGVAQTAAVGALAAAAATGGLGLAEGGMFTGPGYSDTIRATVHPGEYYTPHHEVQRNLAEGRAPGDSGAPRRGESGGTTINVAVQSFVPPSRAQLDHAVHQGLEPSLRSNIRAGRLRLRTA